MEIFVREDGDVYRVFFGPDTAGYIPKESLTDVKKIENILREVSYTYYYKLNPQYKPTVKYRTRYVEKEQGILKDIVDIFW